MFSSDFDQLVYHPESSLGLTWDARFAVPLKIVFAGAVVTVQKVADLDKHALVDVDIAK
jgi:hypothetical protein